MKTRYIIAAALALITFCGIIFGYAHLALYCDQSFESRNVPVLCADTKPEASLALEVTYNVLGWAVLFGSPVIAAVLYARFGWPRSFKNDERNSQA